MQDGLEKQVSDIEKQCYPEPTCTCISMINGLNHKLLETIKRIAELKNKVETINATQATITKTQRQ